MKPFPLTSIVVPLYNDERFIGDCLTSVQRQEGAPFEIVVVDDGSTDHSVEIVQNRRAVDDRIRLIRHDRNRGLAASRNTGIGYARGQFVAFLDADDFMFPGSVVNRARRLRYKSRADRSIAGCYCGWEMVPEDTSIDFSPTKEAKNTRLRYIDVAGENPLVATAPLLWRSMLIDAGGFDETFTTAEDFEFWTRLLRQGYELIPCGTPGVAYRQKRSSMIANGLAVHAAAAIRVLNYVDRPLDCTEVSVRAPGAFRQPIAEHRRQLLLMRRLAVFLAIAVGSENADERNALLRLVPAAARTSDFRSVTGIESSIAAGVKRFELQLGTLPELDRQELEAETLRVLVEHVSQTQEADEVCVGLEFPLEAVRRRGTPIEA